MSYSYSIQGGQAPAFPPREAKQQQYSQFDQYQQDYAHHQQTHLQVRETALPQSSSHLPSWSAKRISRRPTSSVYSQSSFVDPGYHAQQAPPPPPKEDYAKQQSSKPDYGYTDPRTQYQKYRHTDGVSPESSPELSTEYPDDNYASTPYDQNPYYREPSPIDMSATQAVPSNTAAADGRPPSASRTNIPSMRRERRQAQDAAVRTLKETKSRERLQQMQERTSSMSSATSKRGYKGGEVRWDPQTGELTSSQKGRPSQVKPIEYARGLAVPDVPDGPGGSPTESVAQDPKSEIASFASRLKKTVRGSGSKKPEPVSPGPSTPVSLRSVSAAAAPSSSLTVAAAARSPAAAPASPSPSPSPSRDPTDPAAGAFTSNRPAWHGASGRTTLVAPVHDTPDVAPLNIPRRSSKRVGSVPQLQKAMNAAKAANAANLPSPSQHGGNLVSPPESPSPLGVETQGQRTTLRKATSTSGLADASSASTVRRKPTPSHQTLASFDASDPFNYNNRANPNFSTAPPVLRPPVNENTEWAQLASPSSATTYDATIHESLNESDHNDAAEMPSFVGSLRSNPPFAIKRRPTAQAPDSPASAAKTSPPRQKPAPIIISPRVGEGDSVMDRRRPPRLGHSPKTPGNEPILINLNTEWVSTPLRDHPEASDYLSSGGEDTSLYKQLRNKSLVDVNGSDRSTIGGSIHKNLPLAPPETSAKDRVAMLNAQLSNLAQRRMNIGRSIKQMTELMPTDNLLATPDVLQKREMEKRKVEGLRTDLAEVQREEYEIGLKLHRAYKRLDKNAEYEPTSLWVRRVTG